MSTSTKFEKINVLGTDVDRVDRASALEAFREFMQTDELDLIVTPNPEILMNAQEDSETKRVLDEASLVIPDGIGLVYASRILRKPLKERVTGVDLLADILTLSEKEGYTIYFLGAKPGVAEKAAQAMLEKHPGLRILGTRDGYFKPEEEEAIAKEIGALAPDFLCVAMGAPKQEKFVRRYKDILHAKAAMGVGGSLDVWAGTAKRAPEFFQKHGLEWLYRLYREPWRFRRMMALPVFMLKVIFGPKGK